MPPKGGPNGAPNLLLGNSSFPALNQQVSGRFMVIERTEEGETLDNISPIIIEKTIAYWCGEVESIRRNKNGSCIIKTKNDKQANDLLKLKLIGEDINVKVSEHVSLNKSKIVFSYNDSYVMNEEEMLLDIKEKNKNVKCFSVERMKIKRAGKVVPTKSYILTLSQTVAPQFIKVGFIRAATRPFYPRPTRCFQCLQYGHVSKFCTNDKRCFNCSKESHGEACESDPMCINCVEKEEEKEKQHRPGSSERPNEEAKVDKNHRPGSTKCPVWQKENKIIQVRVNQNISIWEARQVVENEVKSSYADATKKNLAQNFEQELKKREEMFLESLKKREEKEKAALDQYKNMMDEMKQQMHDMKNEMEKMKSSYEAEVARNAELNEQVKAQDHTIQKLQKKLKLAMDISAHKQSRKTKQPINAMPSPPRKRGNNQEDPDSDMDTQQIPDETPSDNQQRCPRHRVNSN